MLRLSSVSCFRAAIHPVVSGLSFLGLILMVAGAPAAEPPPTVRIGLLSSLFVDIPEPLVKVSMPPFRTLMRAQTGLNGELSVVANGDVLADQLVKGKAQLGVFPGFEFAWARQKHATLVPLAIIVNEDRHLHAHLMVHRDCPAASLPALQSRSLALYRSLPHCGLFLERQCLALGRDPLNFFSQLTKPATAEDALDDVVEGVVQAAVVDGLSLRCYQRRKPGRFDKLKEIQKSEAFPAAVVVYQAGTIAPGTIERFRDGMINANQQILGRRLLNLWKITGFEKVPADYEQSLAEIVKAYPRQPPANLSAAVSAVKP